MNEQGRKVVKRPKLIAFFWVIGLVLFYYLLLKALDYLFPYKGDMPFLVEIPIMMVLAPIIIVGFIAALARCKTLKSQIATFIIWAFIIFLARILSYPQVEHKIPTQIYFCIKTIFNYKNINKEDIYIPVRYSPYSTYIDRKDSDEKYVAALQKFGDNIPFDGSYSLYLLDMRKLSYNLTAKSREDLFRKLGAGKEKCLYKILDILHKKRSDMNSKNAKRVSPEAYIDQNDHGWTLLHSAVVNNRKNEVELLITRGANVNARDYCENTPLLYAVWQGYKDIVELLIAKGADVNVKNNNKRTALHYANNKNIAELLINAGADVNARARFDITPLDSAAIWGHTDVAELLLTRGAVVRYEKWYGATPLYHATREGHKDIVELLYKYGVIK